MSEIKLNVLDSHTLFTATVHGSVVDALVAALSAEPETVDELDHLASGVPANHCRNKSRTKHARLISFGAQTLVIRHFISSGREAIGLFRSLGVGEHSRGSIKELSTGSG